MNETASHIPTEVYLDFLGQTIPVHWNYHAILMFTVWMVVVPICVMIIRFGKPKPTKFGVTTKISITNPKWWWFNVHKYCLFVATFMALGGAVLAMVVSGGFSGSTHSMFGIATIVMACLQVISALLRGTHGGKYYKSPDLNDPSQWRGDHYDSTPRRKMFEAYHKTSGYFTIFFAAGAVGSGLMQYSMPVLLKLMFILPFVYLAAWILLEFLGRRYDGYRAVHGYGMEHPHNKEREFL